MLEFLAVDPARFCFGLARVQEMYKLANRVRACGLRHALTIKQSTNEQAAKRGAGNDPSTRHCFPRMQTLSNYADRNNSKVT